MCVQEGLEDLYRCSYKPREDMDGSLFQGSKLRVNFAQAT